jgi:serine O-acetyltransferase
MTGAWDAGRNRVLIGAALRAPVTPRLRAVVYFRMSAWCWRHRLRSVALWLQAWAIGAAGAEIHPGAEIGPGLALIHSVGIVVGHEVVAGCNLVLFHGVTLGHTGRGNGQPRIGDDVRVGAGAKVLGPVTVGDGARIGANAVVLADVDPGRTVTGVWRG